MKKSKTYGTKAKIIKGFSNDGQPSKQYFCLVYSDTMELSLICHRFTLTDLPDYAKRMRPLRTFKGKTLYFHWYSIKISTLYEVIDWINGMNK